MLQVYFTPYGSRHVTWESAQLASRKTCIQPNFVFIPFSFVRSRTGMINKQAASGLLWIKQAEEEIQGQGDITARSALDFDFTTYRADRQASMQYLPIRALDFCC